ncbi:MAG: hypothetical protein F4Y45_10055 [Acidobacteria bacterium]|nr:hypothetical protein [Acidobacteriota bacterium]MYD71621.1 hypothetical protein [Acidobacteriota bacterium]MYJ04405.1 hypothetical protein [Acidobacteriota bacterium]
MLTCWFNRRRLAAYLDDELSIPRRIAVDHHLADCPGCARVARRERALSRAVKRAAGEPIDAKYAERLRASGNMVLSRVAAEREVARTAGVHRLAEYPHLVWAAGAACAVTLVCALLATSIVGSVPQPGSLAARLLSLSNPGSNENPLGLRTGMVTPQLSPDALLLSRPDPIPLPGHPTGVTFALVLTQEGTVSVLEVLDSSGAEPPSWAGLVGSAAGSRFVPAEYRGAPVAVNMVWVVEEVTIQGDMAADLGAVPASPAA